MEHYLSHTDYLIWQVIQNGNGLVSVTTDTNGIIKVLPPKTAEEVVARERKRKARTTSLMALPEDHLAKFHKMVDAKELFQTLLSQLEIHGAGVSHEDANQEFLSAPQLDYDDPEQINDDDMEKIDLKWQVAMISIRIKKFYKRTGRKLHFDTKDPVGFDKTKVECFNCHKIRHFARDCRAKGNQDNRRIEAGYNRNKTRDNGRRHAYQDDSKALVTIDGEDIDWSRHVEEDAQNYAMMAYSSSNSGSNNEVKSYFKACEESYARLKKLFDDQRDKLGDASVEITAYTLALKKASDLEDTPINDRFTYGMHVVSPPMTGNYMPSGPDVEIDYSKFTYVWTDAPIIEEYESDSDNDSVSNVQEDKEKPSFAFIDSVKHDNPHRALKDKEIVGCSRHMTGNKSHLVDYQEFKGGTYVFGGSNGRITGKGKIKTGRLDFEDVYYVEELKNYNLFSMSQMRDKKNKVLFTDTDCLVLSPDFKLPNENQVLLKIPRQHNRYNFNLKNIDPSGDLACLFTKALIDESNKWHRRLSHVNFKNLNKLVKGNLVRGLPYKIFENDHTCVACHKGKQHNASCKAKTVSSMNQPLQILHMDLFGPTSVMSINHKTYCLVITDGFSMFSWVYFVKSKDETTPILKDFIRQAENQFNYKVKTIRSDNKTEFKNNELIELCGLKWIKMEYSNSRTPQQIELLRERTVLVTKPQNNTPYELLTGKQPIISYLRPFGCHVTILNTIDQLGKFDRKSDSGFLVGYSLNIKAFRVYNLETKRVKENLHVNFLENKPNVIVKGHAWMLDPDYLTNSMNYEPVLIENQANKFAGPKEANNSACTQANDDQGANSEETELNEEHFILPIWSAYSTTVKSSGDKIKKNIGFNTCENPVIQVEEVFLEELKKLKRQEKEANNVAESLRREATHDIQNASTSSTNLINTANTPLSTAGPSRAFNNGVLTYPDPSKYAFLDDPSILYLKDIYASPSEGIFIDSSYDDKGVISQALEDESWVDAMQKELLQFQIQKITGQAERRCVKTASTPIETQKPLVKDEEAANVDVHLYRSMIGSLMLSTASRPDIMFAVCTCSRFQVTLKTSHLHDVKRIFRYLKGQLKLGLWYPKVSSFDLKAYSDSDYAGANLDRKSTTGEAEYVAIAHYCGQVLWIQNQLLDYGFNFMNTKIYINNESTICIVKNLAFHSKTKHIKIRHHFIRDAYEKKHVQVLKIHTDDNEADLLTKAFDVSSKELASPKQTALGKYISSPLMASRLPKTTLPTSALVPKQPLGMNLTALWHSNHLSYYKSEVQLLKLGDISHHKGIYDNPSLTKKVFVNMKRVSTGFSRVVTLLFDNMLVPATKEVGLIQDDVQSISIPTEPSTSKPHKKHKPKKQQTQAPKVPSPEPLPKHRLPSPSNDPLPGGEDSLNLKELIDLCTHLVNRLKEENSILKELHSVYSKVDTDAPVMEKEKSFKQGRIIADIDEDDVDDEEPAKVEEVLEVVTAAKLITEVVTTIGATTTAEATKVDVLRRRKGVVIQDPEETTSPFVVHSEVQSKDKGKGILIEEPKLLKGQAQIEQDEAFSRKLEAEEDLESLWKLVKERFKKIEPKNYTDDYILKTLKTMFEQPDVEASVRRDKKGRYGLAKRYPLTHFTLEQMMSNVRLEVEEESKMSLELLRLVRRQLNEGYVPERSVRMILLVMVKSLIEET
uniref:Putative ribonuclease H-like domain-containing protein n=1 Tax=Tanacetum cinerariifolium TaxID=118510 RepID=A0A6L2JW01_TANCI|nr:putative ribonuclease H-like domain-containing protein [Tanacetum cinerariifolium]